MFSDVCQTSSNNRRWKLFDEIVRRVLPERLRWCSLEVVSFPLVGGSQQLKLRVGGVWGLGVGGVPCPRGVLWVGSMGRDGPVGCPG